MDATTQIWIVITQSTNLELKNQFLAWKECEILTLTTTPGSKCSQKEANNQSDYQSHNALSPPMVPSLQDLGLSLGQVQDTLSAIKKLNLRS